MSLVPKNSYWHAQLSWDHIEKRAALMKALRSFFDQQGIIEVETPVLCQSTATDLHLHSIRVPMGGRHYYLQTSPEFPMKRLLAQFEKPIYQVTKAFRGYEQGKQHNPEFTMLEWYQPHWDYEQLMCQAEDFFQSMLGVLTVEHFTYRQLFEQHFSLNPFSASAEALQSIAVEHNTTIMAPQSKTVWLDWLFSHVIEPTLGQDRLTIVKDYPAETAALSQIASRDGYEVALRFEVYYKGVELGNGYHELQDASILRKRFESDNIARAQANLDIIPLDENLLSAMENGFPPCAGIAVGIDRLLMVKHNLDTISKAITFTWERA